MSWAAPRQPLAGASGGRRRDRALGGSGPEPRRPSRGRGRAQSRTATARIPRDRSSSADRLRRPRRVCRGSQWVALVSTRRAAGPRWPCWPDRRGGGAHVARRAPVGRRRARPRLLASLSPSSPPRSPWGCRPACWRRRTGTARRRPWRRPQRARRSTYPYRGGSGWSRLVILLGLPVSLGLAAALAFWPRARRAALPAGWPWSSSSPPTGSGRPSARRARPCCTGSSSRCWSPRGCGCPASTGVRRSPRPRCVLAAGLLALPVTARLDGAAAVARLPELELERSAAGGESFDWNHTYGPLDWTRTGEPLLDVESDAPHYWRTAVLDRFDGYRWLADHGQRNRGGRAPSPAPPAPRSRPRPCAEPELDPRPSPSRSAGLQPARRRRRQPCCVGCRASHEVTAPIQGGLALPSDDPLRRRLLRDPGLHPGSERRPDAPRPGRIPRALAPYTGRCSHPGRGAVAGHRELPVATQDPSASSRCPSGG